MAKFSGFILSALLVVLCLWLSVFSYPDVTQSGDLPSAPSTPVVSSSSQNQSIDLEDASIDGLSSDSLRVNMTEATAQTSPDNPLALSSAASQTRYEGRLTTVKDQSNSSGLWDEASLNAETTRVAYDESKIKDAPKASGRAQGGKFVSIPSAKMDAFHLPAGSPYTDRVISTTSAVFPQYEAEYN